MDTPCCERKYHSACGIEKLGLILMHSSAALCECGATLFQYHYPTEVATNATVDALLVTPAVKVEIKAIKTKNTAAMKSMVGFKNYMKEKKAEFSTLIEPHTAAIELAKQNTLTEIKASEMFKECRRLKTSAHLMAGKFQAKHSLGRRQMRRLLGQGNYLSYRWREGPTVTLRREFRLRL